MNDTDVPRQNPGMAELVYDGEKYKIEISRLTIEHERIGSYIDLEGAILSLEEDSEYTEP